MEKTKLLVVAMAKKSRGMIWESEKFDSALPDKLQRKHLLWMCDKIEENAEDWPATKLHRWIGFVQCGMMANRMLDLDGAKAMFNEVKIALGISSEDPDLSDHLDPENPFEIDIGGEG